MKDRFCGDCKNNYYYNVTSFYITKEKMQCTILGGSKDANSCKHYKPLESKNVKTTTNKG